MSAHDAAAWAAQRVEAHLRATGAIADPARCAAATDAAASVVRLGEALARVLAVADRDPLLRDAMADLVCGWLDARSPGIPEPAREGRLRSEAVRWAEMADPAELVAYAGAALAAVERRPIGPSARRRLLAAIWKSMPREDRLTFIRAVAPRAAALID